MGSSYGRKDPHIPERKTKKRAYAIKNIDPFQITMVGIQLSDVRFSPQRSRSSARFKSLRTFANLSFKRS